MEQQLIDIDALEEVIEAIKDDKEYECRVESLTNDIAWAKKKGDTCIEYECY